MISLTVVIPSYNSERSLDMCLNSFCDDRFEDRLEAIIVNDGSTDMTEAIARKYVAKRPNIFHLVNKVNGGHGSAVNTGLEIAHGKYFRIVDSDDWVSPDGLNKLINTIDLLEPDVFIDERTEFHSDEHWMNRIELPQFAIREKLISFDELMGGEYSKSITMHTLTAKTELLRAHSIRLLENTYYVDMQYVIGVSAYAKTACLIRENVYYYRLGSENQSVNSVNYVKNYSHHDKVLKSLTDFTRKRCREMPDGRESQIKQMLTLLARTQYNIALIYNPNRREGRMQARELSRYLSRSAPWLKRSTRSRRLSAGLLHELGFNYTGLQRLKATMGL